MRTLDAGAPAAAWKRDAALFLRLGAMVIGYATTGARLRRAYRRCQERGETLFVDEIGPGGHREEALGRR